MTIKFPIDNSVVLVTGGTGSFGQTFLKRCLATKVSEIRVFSRDESKQDAMRRAFADRRIRYIVGDVRDPESTDRAMRGVDHVFHAAALKQVPSCEFNPMEAVRTNVLGAENVMRASSNNRVRVCVVLSTDKAVQPVNTMGLTKALMEKLMVAASRSAQPGGTVFCATRYGNVMGSRGSVIPLFASQLRAKKPITITNPAMTRFLMSLEESVELVLTAFNTAQQGDIFVRKAPACTIGDLAQAMRAMIDPSGEIRTIGVRHGEKLHESLISSQEMASAEDIGKYFRLPADPRDLNYGEHPDDPANPVCLPEGYNSDSVRRLSVPEIIAMLEPLNLVKDALHA